MRGQWLVAAACGGGGSKMVAARWQWQVVAACGGGGGSGGIGGSLVAAAEALQRWLGRVVAMAQAALQQQLGGSGRPTAAVVTAARPAKGTVAVASIDVEGMSLLH